MAFIEYTPGPDLEALEGTTLEWTASHGDAGVALLLMQFKGKPLMEATVRALLAGVQDLEDATWQVLTERWLDTAIGEQLDLLGSIVGLGRRGWTDSTYRTLIRAQILVLRSSGTWPELFAILEALGVTLTLTTIVESYPAAITITLGEYLDGDIAAAEVFDRVDAARSATVRFVLEFPVSELADTFAFADDDAASSEVADAARGWGDDAGATGGQLVDSLANSEVL